MTEQLYVYRFGNDKTEAGRFRLQFKGRVCKVLFRGNMNSSLIEFVDDGSRMCCSRNAVRKVKI